jgi:hypothetical protein
MMPQSQVGPHECTSRVQRAAPLPGNGAAAQKKAPQSGALSIRETGGVLFRDFQGEANWRPLHPGNDYTPDFWFVK